MRAIKRLVLAVILAGLAALVIYFGALFTMNHLRDSLSHSAHEPTSTTPSSPVSR